MKALEGAFNQEKALVGAFSVITNLRMDLRFKLYIHQATRHTLQFITTQLPTQRGRGRGMLTDSLWPRSTATTLQTAVYALFRANVLLPGA